MVAKVTGIMKFKDMVDGYVVVYSDDTRSGWRSFKDWCKRDFTPEYGGGEKGDYRCSKFLPIELVKR